MSKRELIDIGADNRYVRRNEKAQFEQSADIGPTLPPDCLYRAKCGAKPGEGDRGARNSRR
ncbi:MULTISPECIES: hypothetical protein [Rhizobium]|uniref:Uncharacterized protein n=1 Tax=Rhizobium paranaense TaxID=1650438 RepID=A0A7W8XSV8_9HYPH|nr:hypothetical protein [Rhizobium paranaense]MBB5574979.1 hypothetical protein [Rhizobium paranaense]